ncbi:sigma-70 family RNA polymerase sigma factor [Solirubrobacter taibaiensis]|nr:sigma-70 family RNA polymerase sigma factor [Solirubrobacter taibaiensis]
MRSRAARGDAAAFAAVYERHHQALYRYCRSILRHEEDAQDALQSTMTRAFAALQDEQRDLDIKPWLFRIAHNEAISILRKRRVTTELDDIPVLTDLEDQVSEREQLRLLQMDLADLPDRQRAALVLRELNGLSHAEIAVVLETSAANVKQTIYEARTALFSAREGREMPCDDVRRMLSDGDGRVLRGRGLRAHLRSCAGCRVFQADIKQREKRLAMLAPPLPTAGAAALLSQILGGGTAKLLSCVVLATGGATVAATEFYKPPPRVTEAAAATTPEPKRERPRAQTPTPVPTPVATAIVASTQAEQPAEKQRTATKKKTQAKKPPRTRTRAVAVKAPEPTPAATTAPSARAEAEAEAAPRPRAEKPAKQTKPDKGKPPKAEKPAKVEKPPKPSKDKPAKDKASKEPKSTPTPPPAPTPKAEPPGQQKPSVEEKKERGRSEDAPGHNKTRDDEDDD